MSIKVFKYQKRNLLSPYIRNLYNIITICSPQSVPSILCSIDYALNTRLLFSAKTFPVNRMIMIFHRFPTPCHHIRHQWAFNNIQLFYTSFHVNFHNSAWNFHKNLCNIHQGCEAYTLQQMKWLLIIWS